MRRFCECGCGQLAPLYNQTKPMRGIFRGQPARFIQGHNSRGPGNTNWNGGRAVNAAGYVLLRLAPGEYEYEHRIVAARKLGRPLESDEVVHHIDGDPGNNNSENLMVLPYQGDHIREYARQRAEYLL